MQQKILFLDRDGVLNYDHKGYIKSPDEWEPIPESVEAVKVLKKLGFLLCILSNQSGLGRGYFSETDLELVHAKMTECYDGAFSGIYYCRHHPDEICVCRKPATGLIRRAEQYLSVDARGSFFVGDNITDVLCAINYNLRPILVKTGKGKEHSQKYNKFLLENRVPVHRNLLEATELILEHS